MKLNKEYWTSRYAENNIPWDAGEITTPIKEYVDQLTNKNLKILIPGVGSGHELAYLYNKGFKNVVGLDISAEPFAAFAAKNPDFPSNQLIVDDFFNHTETYDLIIEQTFFCALSPELRPLYAEKMSQLLKTNGKLAGVLFSFPLTEKGPPFGGSAAAYQELFSNYFSIETLQPCYNSIKPRQNSELFIILKK
ncbi:TPMT family class I SAM-dependent methyltransferase [Paenimyroides aestuarii]|uniref:TPMT family class I SAM-dependent methyltransferase n=1 Tax=Paenimyroides aestuarii TaxID=2968490 RepID=A0ABY5NSY3_9FLAO|nr:TPMT family class I SAM-dependent methyltransferase [Paenimyroides aestuarii]UUV21645.1 TPMT family class I SAM-dependent methyltransferase [Paenimyroides aestuarii]